MEHQEPIIQIIQNMSEYWASLPFITIEEAAALAVDIDPDMSNIEKLAQLHGEKYERYISILRVFRKAEREKTLPSPLTYKAAYEFFERSENNESFARFSQYYKLKQSFIFKFKQIEKKNVKLSERIVSLKKIINNERQFKREASLRKLILIIAITKYNYNGSDNPDLWSMIDDVDNDEFGLKISSKTVQKILREAMSTFNINEEKIEKIKMKIKAAE